MNRKTNEVTVWDIGLER